MTLPPLKPAAIAWALAALLLVGCEAASEIPANVQAPELIMPELTGRVVDEADLLTSRQEQQLIAQSQSLEREVGPQLVIVTVPTLQGLPIERYGVHLGRSWGIGDETRNDGVILLVAPTERKVRIEVGYGLENRITDPFAAQVIREQILPSFREGSMAQGIIAGSEAIAERLRSPSSGESSSGADLVT